MDVVSQSRGSLPAPLALPPSPAELRGLEERAGKGGPFLLWMLPSTVGLEGAYKLFCRGSLAVNIPVETLEGVQKSF